jgi:hypothetical protein
MYLPNAFQLRPVSVAARFDDCIKPIDSTRTNIESPYLNAILKYTAD